MPCQDFFGWIFSSLQIFQRWEFSVPVSRLAQCNVQWTKVCFNHPEHKLTMWTRVSAMFRFEHFGEHRLPRLHHSCFRRSSMIDYS